MRDLLKEAKKNQEVSEDELIQYTDTMLQVFDANKDGKLQLSEMAKYNIRIRMIPETLPTSFYHFFQAFACQGELSYQAGLQGEWEPFLYLLTPRSILEHNFFNAHIYFCWILGGRSSKSDNKYIRPNTAAYYLHR